VVFGAYDSYPLCFIFNSFFSRCKFDKFRVTEMLDGRMQLLAELCGSYVPPPIMSTGNRLKMEMTTTDGGRMPRPGFNLDYTFSDGTLLCR